MEKLVEQVQPASRQPPSEGTSTSPAASARDSVAAFSSGLGSEAERTPASVSFDGSDSFGAVSPNHLATSATARRLHSVRQALFDIYPTQHDAEIILANSTGNQMVDNLLYTEHDIATGRAVSPRDVLRRPPPFAHPVIIAKCLLRFALCLSHMPPAFDYTQLDARKPVAEMGSEIVSTVGALVCLDDELISCAEGLDVLSLHMMCQISVGNLRKAWIALRRALSLGDLMGANTPSRLAALPYCDPSSDPAKRPLPAVVWFRINDFERYLSLLLGLPTASRDEAFRTMELSTVLSPIEKLAVAHGRVTGRIIERNLSRMDDYMMTLDIDCELKRMAEEMPAAWWAPPGDGVDAESATDEELMRQTGALIPQTRHYSLVIMLHLPFIMRSAIEPRFAHSKASCRAASREVLSRYVRFRSLYGKRMSCRHMDYYSLVASMTLVLGYVDARSGEPGDLEQRLRDRGLVDVARGKMAEQARSTGDKMTGEAAEVVGQLMPIIDRGVGSCAEAREAMRKGLRLRIPYLGTVSIADGEEGCGMGRLAEAPGCPGDETGNGMGGGDVNAGMGNGASYDDTALRLSVDTGPMDPAVAQGQLDGQVEVGLDGVAGMDMDSSLLLGEEAVMQPGLTADAEDWSLQGIDTTYWSLLNGGFM